MKERRNVESRHELYAELELHARVLEKLEISKPRRLEHEAIINE